ncbi:hypothetical protein OSB04_003250 [Centaurea solstitialis]|uniref:Uncharacterized protein n=1 Tax=Centaurea solstitialis TaxID=347529 RepID=A0AA38TUS6_9ASTR|nr:hypothetical protein OSB04_003250 [Centaurea solstitialis]
MEKIDQGKPKAVKWRNKPILHYNEMLKLFAKDKATGTRAETAKERNNRSKESEKRPETVEEIDELLVMDDITLENFTSVDYINGTLSTPHSQVKIPSSSMGKKRKLENDDRFTSNILGSINNVVDAIDRTTNVFG